LKESTHHFQWLKDTHFFEIEKEITGLTRKLPKIRKKLRIFSDDDTIKIRQLFYF